MAIREVLKIDTSAAHQSTLNTTMDGATLADAESLPNDEEDGNWGYNSLKWDYHSLVVNFAA